MYESMCLVLVPPCTHKHINTCIYANLVVYVHVHVYSFAYVYIYMHIHVHLFVYVRICMQEIDGHASATSDIKDGRHFVRYVGGPHQNDSYDGICICIYVHTTVCCSVLQCMIYICICT